MGVFETESKALAWIVAQAPYEYDLQQFTVR